MVSWSLDSGSLPDGLNLDTNTGLISGTSTAVGTSTFSVRVTDTISNYQIFSDVKDYELAILRGAPPFAGGSGTIQDPYKIITDILQKFR